MDLTLVILSKGLKYRSAHPSPPPWSDVHLPMASCKLSPRSVTFEKAVDLLSAHGTLRLVSRIFWRAEIDHGP